MSTKEHPLLGKWRITNMELWDAEFIDLPGPGYIPFDADGRGEFAFGAVRVGSTATSVVTIFTSPGGGSDEMDHACGDGDAQLEEDGTLTGVIRFHLGDESSFAARSW
jgi:hypothetical protein